MDPDKTRRIETLAWVALYGGLLAACLGWFVAPALGPWGELLLTGGLAAAVLGVVLIVVRSRLGP